MTRRPKFGTERATANVYLRVTREIKDTWQTLAEGHGMPLTQWVIWRLLDGSATISPQKCVEIDQKLAAATDAAVDAVRRLRRGQGLSHNRLIEEKLAAAARSLAQVRDEIRESLP